MEENSHKNSHIEASPLLKSAKDSLSLKGCDQVSLDRSLFLSLMRKEEVKLPFASRCCSSMLAQNIEEDISYPLFFFSVKKTDKGIQLEDCPFLWNPMAKEFLTHLGIHIPDFSDMDILPLIQSVNFEVERRKVADKVQIIPYYDSFSESVLQDASVYSTLNDWMSGKIEERYKGLSREIEDTNSEIEAIQRPGLFGREDRALKRLEKYASAKVSYVEKGMEYHFLNKTLDELFFSGQKVGLLVPKEEKESIKNWLEERRLMEFTYDVEKPNSELPNIALKEEEEKEFQDYRKALNSLLELEQIKEEKEAIPPSLLEDVLTDYPSLKSGEDLSIDIRDYHENDYLIDRKFLNLVSTSPLMQIPVSLHPFYGLTAPNTRDSYDSLQLLLIDLMTALKKFSSALQEEKSLVDFDWVVSSLEEYQEMEKNIEILRGYNGFPKKYFKIQDEEGQLASLDHLKSLYQAVSSSRLLVSNLCHPNIFIADIQKLVRDYEEGNLIQKLLAKRKLVSYLKNKKNPDMKTLTRILSTYLSAQKKLEEALPSYEEFYGDNVLTMNGVIEIKSNIQYIQHFHQRSKELPGFTLEEPFVKKWMNNKNFRQQMDGFLSSINGVYQDIESLLKQYIGYFYDAPKIYEKMEFDDLISFFQEKKNHGFEEYQEYGNLKEAFEPCSLTLKLIVRKYEGEKRTFLHLKESFLLSLWKGYVQKGRDVLSEKVDDYEGTLSKYLSYSLRNNELLDKHRVYQISQIWQNERAKNRENENAYPLTIFTKEYLPFLETECFDTIVILNSSLLSDKEMINAYRVGKSVLILDDITEADMRTQGYHNTVLSDEAFLNSFSQNSPADDKLLEYVRQFLTQKGYVPEKKNYFPCCLSSKVKEGYAYAPLPNYSLKDNLKEEDVLEIQDYLLQNKTVLLVFDVNLLFLEPEKEMTLFYKVVSQAMTEYSK